jgi:hypothetical protein
LKFNFRDFSILYLLMSQPGGPVAGLHRQHLSKVQKTVLRGDVTKGTAEGFFFIIIITFVYHNRCV